MFVKADCKARYSIFFTPMAMRLKESEKIKRCDPIRYNEYFELNYVNTNKAS